MSDFSDLKWPKREDPNLNEHRADLWINTLYAGGPGSDTRNKLRRGWEAGYAHCLAELRPWMPDDAPHLRVTNNYHLELLQDAAVNDVVVPANDLEWPHEFLRVVKQGDEHPKEFKRVRVHGRTGWLRVL